MSELIEEFKRDHAEIMAILNEVKEFGILSKEGHAKLISIKEHLLAHLKKEDEKLYPALRKKRKIMRGLGHIGFIRTGYGDGFKCCARIL